ncbi:TniQ family protein [Agrobacterium sp. BA1120]|uniref:TniQ family protein n=1 Tax=Agrobacterium sp. BA1120 TaxID=3228927 RepID=UPI00336AC628
MVLPVTLDYHADETAIDFVARLAAANGFSSLRSFLGHTNVTAKAIVQGEDDALSLVSEWSGMPIDALGKLAVKSSGPASTWQMGFATLSKAMHPGRVQRFCAKCVVDDRNNGTGRPVSRPYRRAWWGISGIEGCPDHGCMITKMPVDADVDLHDFPRFVDAELASILATAAAPTASRQPQLDRYLRDRLIRSGGDGFLDQLDVHVAAELSRYIGEFVALHGVAEWMRDESDLAEWGFTLSMRGEEEIRRVLAEVIECKRPMVKHGTTVLGPMHRWLSRNKDKEAYENVVNLVQDVIERNMPFGDGQTIFKPVRNRYLHCLISAQEKYGLNPDRIRALVKETDPGFRDGLSDACSYFVAAALHPVLQAACETLTSKEASEVLGVREKRVLDFLEIGLLKQVETRANGERSFTRIPKSAVVDLVHQLETKLAVTDGNDDGISLSEAARLWKRPFRLIVGMLLEGDLKAYAVSGSDPILQRARVKADAFSLEVGPKAGSDDELMRLKEAMSQLGTTTGTVSELIKRGFLRSRVLRRDTVRKVTFIERRSVLEFQEVYVSLTQIAKSRQGYRAAIKAELDQAGISPIFEPQWSIARFYRRSEIRHIV